MRVNIRTIGGNWDAGVVLDKHTVSSVYLGEDENGRAQFDTTRTDVGEAVFQLKYRHDWNHVRPLAQAIVTHAAPLLQPFDLVVPMPASHQRARQPVVEIARAVAALLRLPCDEQLIAKAATPQLKNLTTREEKEAVLDGAFRSGQAGRGPCDVLLVDDLYHTGASMAAACAQLRSIPSVRRITVVALRWR